MRLFIALALFMVLFTTIASAETQHIFSSGHCANGNDWWCVTTIVDGTVSVVSGLGCDGVYYRCGCTVAVLPTNPFAGQDPTYSGVCAGSGVTWQALLSFDENHHVVDVVGQDCRGQYYRAGLQPMSIKPLNHRLDVAPSSPASPGRNIH